MFSAQVVSLEAEFLPSTGVIPFWFDLFMAQLQHSLSEAPESIC